MVIALGVHVGVDDIAAALIEDDLPELGPIAARTVSIAAVPGGIGDAVTTVLGIMRVQAAQNDLRIAGSAIVCDTLAQCETVLAALANHDVRDVEVVHVGDSRLGDDYSLDIAAALIGTGSAPAVWTNEAVAAGAAPGDEVSVSPRSDGMGSPRSARLTMIGLGIAVLAALSGATVWALAASDPTQNPVVGTADVAQIPSSGDGATGSSAALIADSAGAPAGPSIDPSIETAMPEAPSYGPVPVDTWSDVLPAGPVPGSGSEASSGGGGSGGGNPAGPRPGVVAGGGGSGGDDSDGDADGGGSGGGSGGEETPTGDPEPETEVPTTTPPVSTTEVPVTTEPTTDPEPSEDPVE
ncbi:hypothetical protein [Rhodococcus sp. 077-4]|uniref:hypothetical protein n=1 Tax=Rhodococcus sp. 077-4 TaxID=2789271 RepID=UPI0039F5D2B2